METQVLAVRSVGRSKTNNIRSESGCNSAAITKAEEYPKCAIETLDIPMVLPRDYRDRRYAHLAAKQPGALIMFNAGIGDGSALNVNDAWPTDLVAIERFLPNSHTGHVKWRSIEGRKYYVPGEVCDPIGKDWFYADRDQPRSDGELLGMYLVSRKPRLQFPAQYSARPHGPDSRPLQRSAPPPQEEHRPAEIIGAGRRRRARIAPRAGGACRRRTPASVAFAIFVPIAAVLGLAYGDAMGELAASHRDCWNNKHGILTTPPRFRIPRRKLGRSASA